ncbi:syncytin-1-like [Dipodomys spectabilis]|uniref:syncytin-1-like n=1 Tax=Dipodomys spectabilis TaxID=105255 RepID=UPI001C535D2B|nr:syncytin-1-like [Dipodomys spectabilis]
MILMSALPFSVYAGFGGPVDRQELLKALFGPPCECRGGRVKAIPEQYTNTIDCGTNTAYLSMPPSNLGGYQKQTWVCVDKPRIIPATNGIPGSCPASCNYADQMHSSCYSTVQECTGASSKRYFTAILQKTKSETLGGEWSNVPQVMGSTNKYSQASCSGKVGQDSCWPTRAPIHVSDGAGPTDIIRETEVRDMIEELENRLYPKIDYHPLALPKPRGTDLDALTLDILETTLSILNSTSPGLAIDCWLCMPLGAPMPLAIPSDNPNITNSNSTCSPSLPFKTQPVGNFTACIYGNFQNNSLDIDIGLATFGNCIYMTNYSSPTSSLCPPKGKIFICGGNLAFTMLPANWTGLCMIALLLPDIDIVPGDEPLPTPSLEMIGGRRKRAVQLIPLLVGLGVTAAMGTGTAGLGVAVHSYAKLSNQLINDVQTLSSTINDLQDQIDSLAEVVLQNRRGLDLLTAEQGGICLALQERCCFYANKSGIVRDKIKRLQEDLIKRRRELFDSPLWTWLNGLLPYLLPLLGPLLVILILATIVNRLSLYCKRIGAIYQGQSISGTGPGTDPTVPPT